MERRVGYINSHCKRLIIKYSSVNSTGELNKRYMQTAGAVGRGLRNADTGSKDVKEDHHLDAEFRIMLKLL
jgi:hypothetical protein